MPMKEYVLKKAYKNADRLEKWGEGIKRGTVGLTFLVGSGLYAIGVNPENIVRYAGTPAALLFAYGEGMKVLGEYSKDWKNGEVDPVKNAGYVARILAPLYAAPFAASGAWTPVHEIGIPAGLWLSGLGATEAGKKKIKEKKTKYAEKLVRWAPQNYFLNLARDHPDVIRDALVNKVPMNELRRDFENIYRVDTE